MKTIRFGVMFLRSAGKAEYGVLQIFNNLGDHCSLPVSGGTEQIVEQIHVIAKLIFRRRENQILDEFRKRMDETGRQKK